MNSEFSFSALRERRAVRYIIGYLVAGWAVTQAVGFFVEQGYVGRTVLDVTLFLAVVGFFVALVLVWFHGEEGRQKVPAVERLLLGALAVVAAVGGWVVAGRGQSSVSGGPPTEVFVDLGDRSIAVLPFTNDLAEPSMAWLDRGVSELLATDLAQVPSLRVVGGQRVLDLLRQLGEGESRTVPEGLRTEVTRLAGARYLLTGSIFGSVGNLVLTASMEDADTGEITAAARQQGTDVFALVDAVSAELLDQSLAPGSGSTLAPVGELTTRSLDAYAEYRKGVEAQGRFLYPEARTHLARAVELDSTFARASMNLAGVQVSLGEFGAAMESLTRARNHVHTASEQERLFIEGLTAMIGGDMVTASAKYEELISRYPAEKEARILYAPVVRMLGRPDEARTLLEDLVRLDPSYGQAYNELAYDMARGSDFDSALVLVDRLIALEPDQPNPLDSRGEILEMAGRFEEAKDAYRSALEMAPDFDLAVRHLARAHMRTDQGVMGRAELLALADASVGRSSVQALSSAGDLWIWDGDFEAGFNAYREAVDAAAEMEATGAQIEVLRILGFNAMMLGRLDLADSVGQALVEVDAGEAMTRDLMRVVIEGERGAPQRITQIADAFVEEHASDPNVMPFLGMVANTMGGVGAFYRGEYQEVLDSASAAPLARANGFEYPGLPVLRSLVRLGRGDELPLQIRVARNAGVMGGQGRFGPALERLLLYYEGRGLELQADTVGAVAAYRRLLDAWGEATREVPWVADTPDRVEALSGTEG